MGGRLFDWMGSGVAASRPLAAAMPALLVSPGSTAFYFATDTKILSVFDESGPAWFDIDAAALAAIAFATLPDVDLTGIVDGDGFKWDAGLGQVVPLALAFQDSESIQDLVGAMISNGAGMNVIYNDGTGQLEFASTITQYNDEAAQDAIAAAIAAGSHTGLTVNYNDALNKFDFTVTITQYTDEMAQDAIGATLGGTQTGIAVAYNDAAGTFSFIVDGAWVDARANARIAASSIDALNDVDTTTTPPTDGQVMTWSASAGKWLPAASGAATGFIEKKTFNNTVNTYTFSTADIQNYDTLELEVFGRSAVAAVNDSCIVRINGLTTAIYDNQRTLAQATQILASEVLGQSSGWQEALFLQGATAQGANAASVGGGRMIISLCRSTTLYKLATAHSRAANSASTANAYDLTWVGEIHSTAAITSITIFTLSGSFFSAGHAILRGK